MSSGIPGMAGRVFFLASPSVEISKSPGISAKRFWHKTTSIPKFAHLFFIFQADLTQLFFCALLMLYSATTSSSSSIPHSFSVFPPSPLLQPSCSLCCPILRLYTYAILEASRLTRRDHGPCNSNYLQVAPGTFHVVNL